MQAKVSSSTYVHTYIRGPTTRAKGRQGGMKRPTVFFAREGLVSRAPLRRICSAFEYTALSRKRGPPCTQVREREREPHRLSTESHPLSPSQGSDRETPYVYIHTPARVFASCRDCASSRRIGDAIGQLGKHPWLCKGARLRFAPFYPPVGHCAWNDARRGQPSTVGICKPLAYHDRL